MSFFSNIFFESTNPILVLPNELGPELVGVFLPEKDENIFEFGSFFSGRENLLPIFLILILHSAGISSVSSSLDSLNALATDGLGFGRGAAGFTAGTFSFICNFPDDDVVELLLDFRLIEIFEMTGAGGAWNFSFRLSSPDDGESEDELFLLRSGSLKNR